MAWWEVQHYIDGMRKRQRPQWESTRWLAWLVGKMLSGLKTIDDPQELCTFPWEKELEDPEAMMEANQKLLAELEEQNKRAQEEAKTTDPPQPDAPPNADPTSGS